MEESTGKYQKVLELLRRSSPRHGHPDILEEKIMDSLKTQRADATETSRFTAFLFGWTRIAWIRRALSAAAAVIILLLAYQQSIIVRQINAINQQLVPGKLVDPSSGTAGSMKLLLYRFSGGGDQYLKENISEEEFRELIESLNLMNEKYRELMKLIDEDPELKKLIEEKIGELPEKDLPGKSKL